MEEDVQPLQAARERRHLGEVGALDRVQRDEIAPPQAVQVQRYLGLALFDRLLRRPADGQRLVRRLRQTPIESAQRVLRDRRDRETGPVPEEEIQGNREEDQPEAAIDQSETGGQRVDDAQTLSPPKTALF